MAWEFHNPPGWPVAPTNWYPASTWRPDPSWPPPPPGWVFWTDTSLWLQPTQTTQLLAPVAAPSRPASAPRSGWLTRLAWIPTLVFGIVTYLIVLRVMLATQNPNLFPTLLFIGAITVPASVLMLVYGLGHRVGHNGALVVATAIVGGIIGVISASDLESSVLVGTPGTGLIAVAVIEETAKMIVPLAIFLFLRRRSPGLGVILGIASGAGFAVLETMGYGFSALLSTGGNVAAVDQTLVLRALLSPASHVAWTGIVAAALWRTADPRRPFRAPLLIGAFVAAVALHATWDITDATSVQVAVAVVSLAVLIIAVVTGVRTVRAEPMLPRAKLVMAPPMLADQAVTPSVVAPANATRFDTDRRAS